ncbi:hypothetical protein BD626DRAFT_509966, partial [Schizophyllum amplum]
LKSYLTRPAAENPAKATQENRDERSKQQRKAIPNKAAPSNAPPECLSSPRSVSPLIRMLWGTSGTRISAVSRRS